MPEMGRDYLVEHAYLVSRGVRPMALAGHCKADHGLMAQVALKLEEAAEPGAIPFVVDRGDGIADYGFSSTLWALDLLKWVQSDAAPVEHRHRIIGLLLGYSPESIRAHEELARGRYERRSA